MKILKQYDTTAFHWCNEAVLVSITNGIGALAVNYRLIPDDYYGSLSYRVLELNHTPLVQARFPSCPTCAGMLATGYGIENANSTELKLISEQLNSDYVDISESLQAVTPMLHLLQSGLYIVADTTLYPTDGNGHFFWDVPNLLTENPATALVMTEDYGCISSLSSFLYPSQSNDRFDEQRVQYYIDRFSQTENWPRAISYQFCEFISILLDGHHKATAAAMLGKKVPCLNIIPLSAISSTNNKKEASIDKLYFSGICIDAKSIPSSILKQVKENFGKPQNNEKLTYTPTTLLTKPWEQKYRDTVNRYPNLFELATQISLGIGDVTDELINDCLQDLTERNLQILRFIVSQLARKNDVRFKKLALKCGKLYEDPELVRTSFNALVQLKGDIDVEKFFIDYLIDHSDKHDMLIKIAERFFE